MLREHRYIVEMEWTGNSGTGTSGPAAYSRSHTVRAAGKLSDIPGSSDPAFRGDPSRYNPEELLVAALSACHMLWYLSLCATAGIVVESYIDRPEGIMPEEGGEGQIALVTLHPEITISKGDEAAAAEIHHEAHRLCYVARSVNFPVACQPVIRRAVSQG
jgi:organic hydroperoxide reductase OsmC/OhrA